MGLPHRNRVRRIVVALSLLVASILAPAIALADEASAEQLFQEGLAAMKRNDLAVACDAFGQSNKADPSPGTQINLAVCFEKRRMWASAWTWYRSAVGLAQQRGQKEREQLAEDAANRLKPSIHYVVISVKEPLADVVVKRDGNEVSISVGGKELPMAVDPGDHTIELSARGKKPWTRTIRVADNALTERIEVPPLESAAEATPVNGAPPAQPVYAGSDGSGQRTVGIVVGAAGVLAGLAAGGVFILAKNEESDRDAFRAQQHDAEKAGKSEKEINAFATSANSHSDAADNDQLIALILGGGAVVLLATGAILYFTAPSAPRTEKSHFMPLVGPGFAGLGFGATF